MNYENHVVVPVDKYQKLCVYVYKLSVMMYFEKKTYTFVKYHLISHLNW